MPLAAVVADGNYKLVRTINRQSAWAPVGICQRCTVMCTLSGEGNEACALTVFGILTHLQAWWTAGRHCPCSAARERARTPRLPAAARQLPHRSAEPRACTSPQGVINLDLMRKGDSLHLTRQEPRRCTG